MHKTASDFLLECGVVEKVFRTSNRRTYEKLWLAPLFLPSFYGRGVTHVPKNVAICVLLPGATPPRGVADENIIYLLYPG